jgi:hypothetical protein
MSVCRLEKWSLPPAPPALTAACAAGLAVVFWLFPGVARPDDPVPEDPPVTFSLTQGSAHPGEKVTLTCSLTTTVSLRSISVAMDFDESLVRVLEARRSQLAFGNEPVPGDVASISVNNSNADPAEGNQSREGWIHLELDIEGKDAELPLAKGVAVPILEIDFLVLPDAGPGFTPVAFATVGPVDALPAAYLVNRVVIAGALADIAEDLPRAALKDGGIDIIGEVGFFMRADANFDRRRDISDPIVSLGYLFLGGPPLPCLEAADANDDGLLDISDPIFTLARLFEGAGQFPEPDRWGPDPTPDPLGCAAYPGQ